MPLCYAGNTGNIAFKDVCVKTICVQRWDTNSDGELSYAEAAAVTSLRGAFQSNTNIVYFNELQYFTGIRSITRVAFRGCSSLTNITIPDSVASIGYYAFSGCTALTNITIPDNIRKIEDGVFC